MIFHAQVANRLCTNSMRGDRNDASPIEFWSNSWHRMFEFCRLKMIVVQEKHVVLSSQHVICRIMNLQEGKLTPMKIPPENWHAYTFMGKQRPAQKARSTMARNTTNFKRRREIWVLLRHEFASDQCRGNSREDS